MTTTSSPVQPKKRAELRLGRRLSRHFIALSVVFGASAGILVFIAFSFFHPLLVKLDSDWVRREKQSIHSVGGLEAAVLTTRLLELFDRSAEEQVRMWSALRQHPELAYARLFSTINAEIATVYRDGLSFSDLPQPLSLSWDRSVYPPRLRNQGEFEKVQMVQSSRHTFHERRMLLYRESFGRIFPVAVLTAGFDKQPASMEEADRLAEQCVQGEITSGTKVTEGWPSGRVLANSAGLTRYSYTMRDMALYLAELKKGTENLETITVYNQNGMPFLSERQNNSAFQFTEGLKGDASLVRMTAHVRQSTHIRETTQHGYDVFTPVFHHGALRGMIEFRLLGQASLLGYFREGIHFIRQFMTATTIALTVLMILASVALAFRLRSHIARPLEEIADASLAFVHGTPTDPVHLERARALADAKHYTRESRELSEAYAQMVTVIQQTLKEKDDAFAALESKDKQLFASQRQSLLGVVAAGVAHEIKNALNPVKLRAERMLMAHQMKRDVGLEDGLNLILHSVGRCAEISNKLSTFARPADVASFFPFDLNEVVRDALAISNDVLGNAKIKATTQLSDIPKFKGNPKEVQQALINFLLNSKDAILDICARTKREGGNITISTKAEDRFVVLKITDDGCGMTDEAKKKIFIPFFTTKEPGKGTGLGMGVSQGILQAHGADIHVESQLNVGTTITVRFPVNGPPLTPPLSATTTVFGRPPVK